MANKKKEEIRADIVVDGSGTKKGADQVVDNLERVEDAFDELADDAKKKGEQVEESSSKMGAAFSKIGEAIGEIVPAVSAALAGAGALGVSLASDFVDSQTKIQNSFGLTGDEAQKMNAIVKDVWSDGFGESVEDVTETLVKVKQQLKGINDEDLADATKYAQVYAETFDADVTESLRGVNALMEAYGMTAEEAFDYMTTGAQKGLNKTDELGDNLAEYATLFEESGYSASEMFDILQAGLDAGAYNLDKVNDLVKEFAIRVADGSVKSAVDDLGGSFKKTFDQLTKDGASNKEIFNALAKEVTKLGTEQEKAAAISAIWGSLGEDNGTKVIEAMADVEQSYTDVDGAAKKMVKTAKDDPFSRMKKTAREFQEALIPIAEIALDMADAVLPALNKASKLLSDTWNDLSPEMQEAAGVMLTLASAAAGGKLAFGALSSIFGGMLNPLKLFTSGGKEAGKAAGEMGEEALKAGGKFGGLGSKILGTASSFGPWGVAVGAGILAIGGLGVAVDIAGKKADESRERVYKWGSDVGEEADKTLTKYQTFSDGATTAMSNFDSSVKGSAESVADDFAKISESVDNMMTSIEKASEGAKTSIDKNLKKLPDWMQENLKQATDAQKEQIDRSVQLAQNAATQTLDIYKKHSNDVSELTEAEKDIVLNNQKIMNNQQVELLELSSKEKKSVIAALNGDLENLTDEQLRNHIDNVAIAMDKENSLYNKQKGVLKDMWKAGQISTEDYEAQLNLLTETHTSMTDTIAANMLKAQRASGDSEAKIQRDMERMGFDYESAAKIVEEETARAADSNNMLAQSTKNMSNDVIDANQQWNALIFDSKTGEVKTNAQEEVSKAMESKDGWNQMQFIMKNANLSSNAQATIASAAIDNGKWNEMSWEQKKAVIDYKGSEKVIKAMEDAGSWNKLTVDQKKMIATADTSLALQTALVDMGVWDQLPEKTKKLLMDNSDVVEKINSSEGMIVEYNGEQVNLKTLLANNTDVLTKLQKGEDVIINYNNKPINLKYLYANNSDLQNKINAGNNAISGYNSNDPETKHANAYTNESTFNNSVDNMFSKWTGTTFGSKTASIAINAAMSASKNANGTPSFDGGLTTLHERGDEVYYLPSGATVMPHSLSQAMAERTGSDLAKSLGGGGNTFTQAINIENFNNNRETDITTLMQQMGKEAKRRNPWRP
ncbi:phage tail tape measure protein [Listeria ilorinensis]|uniref:phage tail tape measure protein n=1 Tax=Listeria ilorinensis TaxID=2867439 RepID=UPI001EF4A409|nr:phage tail tape measure protein [Listeria ilorinensis]